MARPEALIEQLKTGDYYARSTAARALGEMGGEKAEVALVEALADQDDWVKEYAAEALGKLRSRRAIAPLGDLLNYTNYKVRSSAAEALGKIGGDEARRLLEPLAEESDLWVREAALNALKRISGQESLTGSESFSLAAKSAPGVENEPELSIDESADEPEKREISFCRAPAGRTPLTTEDLIKAIVRNKQIKYRTMQSGYLLRVPVGEGRFQKVRLKFGSKDEDGSPIIQIFTLIAPANPEHYQWVLKLNPAFSYGAIGIVKIDGREFFALTNTILEESIDTKAIEKSVRIIAEKGDALEQKLIRKDLW